MSAAADTPLSVTLDSPALEKENHVDHWQDGRPAT
jgi:hypothetical protein